MSIDVRTGFCFDRQEDFHYFMVLWFSSGNGIAKVTTGLWSPSEEVKIISSDNILNI